MIRTRKVGGIRFLWVGRYVFSFCRRSNPPAVDRYEGDWLGRLMRV